MQKTTAPATALTYRTRRVYYDATIPGDYNRALAEARRRRPAGETGTIIAIERGGRWHREMMKQHGDHHHGE